MEKFIKTPEQVAALMQHWFLSYHKKDKDSFSGSDTFTFFGLKPEALQKELLQRVSLDKNEKPVFLLDCSDGAFILNTTHRFIRIGKSDLESMLYSDFDRHEGYKTISFRVDGNLVGVKTDGYLAEFGLHTRSGEIVYWPVPTGGIGFAFWNITKKCELIGRKYLIVQKEPANPNILRSIAAYFNKIV